MLEDVKRDFCRDFLMYETAPELEALVHCTVKDLKGRCGLDARSALLLVSIWTVEIVEHEFHAEIDPKPARYFI